MKLPKLPPWRVFKGRAAYVVSGLIAVAGAVLSYGALAEIGNAAVREVPGLFGIEPPWAGRIWAATVDGFILLGFLKVGDGPPWQVVLAIFHIVAGLAASLAFQWFHAQGKVDPLAVAVTPPAAVFLSLDTWALPKMLAHLAERKEVAGADREPAPAPTSKPAPVTRVAGVGESVPEGSPTSPPVRPAPPKPAAKSTPGADRSAERSERARIIREQLAADPLRSANKIKAALKSAGAGVGESGAFYALVEQVRSEMKQESNGTPERVEVLS